MPGLGLRATTVHVIGGSRGGACLALRVALPGRFSVRHCESLAEVGAARPGDIAVVDLSDTGPRVRTKDIAVLARGGAAFIVCGDAPVDPAWLTFVSERRVAVVQRSGTADAGYGPLIAALVEATRRRPKEELTRRILSLNPALDPAANLVKAIAENPWKVRHPRDLARVASIRFRSVRVLARAAGFKRVEHLITVVRQAIIEETASVDGLPRAACMWVAGVTDYSNHRRQLARARVGSPADSQRINSPLSAIALR
jgi:hypothetical protein